MAFYRKEGGFLSKSDNSLFGPGFDLIIQDHENYNYPVEGWYWFDTDAEAIAALEVDFALITTPPSEIIL